MICFGNAQRFAEEMSRSQTMACEIPLLHCLQPLSHSQTHSPRVDVFVANRTSEPSSPVLRHLFNSYFMCCTKISRCTNDTRKTCFNPQFGKKLGKWSKWAVGIPPVRPKYLGRRIYRVCGPKNTNTTPRCPRIGRPLTQIIIFPQEVIFGIINLSLLLSSLGKNISVCTPE